MKILAQLAIVFCSLDALSQQDQILVGDVNEYKFSQIDKTSSADELVEFKFEVTQNSDKKRTLEFFTQLRPQCRFIGTPFFMMIGGQKIAIFCGSTGPEHHETLIAIRDRSEPIVAMMDSLEGYIPKPSKAIAPAAYAVERLVELEKYGGIRTPIRYELVSNHSIFSFARRKLFGTYEEEFIERIKKMYAAHAPTRNQAVEVFVAINSLLASEEVCHTYGSIVSRDYRLPVLMQKDIKLLLADKFEIQICDDQIEYLNQYEYLNQ